MSMTSHRRLQIGLIGAGARGADHARVVAAAPAADLAVVVDPDLDRAALLAAPAGAVSAADPDVVFGCDAVVVASPTRRITTRGGS